MYIDVYVHVHEASRQYSVDEGVDLAWESIMTPVRVYFVASWMMEGRLVWNLTDVRLGNGLGSDLIFQRFSRLLIFGFGVVQK